MEESKRQFTPVEVIRLLGWTNAEAAEQLGCSHMTIARRKNGTSAWRVPEIVVLSKASGIPVEQIIF